MWGFFSGVMIFGRLELGTFGFWLAQMVSQCKLRGEEHSTLAKKQKKKQKKQKFIITKRKGKGKVDACM